LAVVKTLIKIRQRSALDLMDLALVLVRSRPGPIVLASLFGCLPFAALNLWLTSGDPEFPGYVYYLLLALEMPWATVPLTIVLGGMMFGERPSAWKVVKTTLRSLIPLFLLQFLLRGLMVLVWILIPVLPARLAFINEVVLLERGRWRRVYDRTGVLCGDQGGDLFLRAIGHFFFGFGFVFAFWWAWRIFRKVAVFGSSWEDFEGPSAEIPLFQIFVDFFDDAYQPSVQAGFWIAVSFFGIVRFLTYIDQRIRLEGWEVELRLRQVGAAMEEEQRW
jgi:hypothetical protein